MNEYTYLDRSLMVITYYIRGKINLYEAIDELSKLGHNKKSVKKVLKSTKRNNIINFKKYWIALLFTLLLWIKLIGKNFERPILY